MPTDPGNGPAMTDTASPHPGSPAVRRVVARDGMTSYLVGVALPELTPVLARDVAAAWDAARGAAVDAAWGCLRLFRFRAADGTTTDLALADPDASCWAAAVDSRIGLDHVYGIAVCVRLLALVDLMASADWAGRYFTVKRDGAEIDPALLRAAATLRLTAHGRLDPALVRRALDDASALSPPRHNTASGASA